MQKLESFYSLLGTLSLPLLSAMDLPTPPEFSGLLEYAPGEKYLNEMFQSYVSLEARSAIFVARGVGRVG